MPKGTAKQQLIVKPKKTRRRLTDKCCNKSPLVHSSPKASHTCTGDGKR